MGTGIETKRTNSLEYLKILELKELLKKAGFILEPSGEIIEGPPGTLCGYYIRPLSGSWEYLRNKFFYSQSNLNTWGDAIKILKKNLLEKEETFLESGVTKSLSLKFEDGEFIVKIKNV